MIRCTVCSTEPPDGSRYCPTCGNSLAPSSETPTQTSIPEDTPTTPAGRRPGSSTPGAGRFASAETLIDSQFLPGAIVADRYRIVGLIGRGGMGEVYRADDLKLGQPVALKFLPEAVDSQHRLSRFINEVRVARRVSHPHVCRVYDIGEVDGRHYLSMEYIDGEDLASLMRRAGRLSGGKAVQIARQLCTGLASAHRLGILHRDLKPANIMIDGRGQVRITDFGLAGLAADIAGEDIRAGTPAYMSPEQLAGKEVTTKSDLYALGLVLYELFTGKPPFKADTAAEMSRLQLEESAAPPTSIAGGIDPSVESVIQRCLEKSPSTRPASAMAVSAGLPGGDPLTAALEAGETPSPQLVADAGAVGGLRPAVAASLLALFAVGLVVVVSLIGQTQISGLTALDKAPAVLEERAEEIVRNLGYDADALDHFSGFFYDVNQLEWIADNDPSPTRWERLRIDRPSAITYWFRQSPRHLVRYDQGGRPSYSEPPRLVPEMVAVQLDTQGRLRRFDAVPPEVDNAADSPYPAPDWSVVFGEAGLSLDAFTPIEATWVPEVFADARWAWEGRVTEPPGSRIRVEAAAVHGKPVFFRIIDPWTRPTYSVAPAGIPFGPVARAVAIAWFFVAMIGAVLVALRNLRLGRGDRKGAFRLALYMLCTGMLVWLCGSHHVADLAEIGLMTSNLAFALYIFCLTWIFYIALEPYLRRLWPKTIVSWVRLLDGRFRDPLVGRDLLVGALYGVVMAFGPALYHLVPRWLGKPPPRPDILGWSFLEMTALPGMRETVSALLYFQWQAVIATLLVVIGLLLLRLLLRHDWPAIVVTLLLTTILANPAAGNVVVDLLFAALGVGLWLLVLFRFGLLSVTIGTAVASLLLGLPTIFDFSHWYAGRTLLAVALVGAVALYGFFTSLGGRSLFGDTVLEP